MTGPEETPPSSDDPFATPPPPMAKPPANAVPPNAAVPPPQNTPGYGPTPQYGKPPRKFHPGTVFLGIVVGIVGMVIVGFLGAALQSGATSSGNIDVANALATLTLFAVVAAPIVPGIVMVRRGSASRRGWGMGLLLSVPVGLFVGAGIGLVVCIVAISGGGY